MQAGGRAGAMALRQEGAVCSNELKKSMCGEVQNLQQAERRASHSRLHQQVKQLWSLSQVPLDVLKGFKQKSALIGLAFLKVHWAAM